MKNLLLRLLFRVIWICGGPAGRKNILENIRREAERHAENGDHSLARKMRDYAEKLSAEIGAEP
jgi:hypothetical protein